MHAWAEVCHLLQSSKSLLTGFLCSVGWRIIGLSSNAPHSISNSAMLCNNYIFFAKWFVRMCTRGEKWHHKGSHSSLVSSSNRLVWLQTWKKAMCWCTAQWKMLLFCVKTIVKESCKFELAHLKKKKKKKKERKKERKKEIRKTFDGFLIRYFCDAF